MIRIKIWFQNLSDEWRAALATAAWTFVGVFSLALTNFFGDVVSWAQSSEPLDFPDVSLLGKSFVAAAASAAAGVGNFIYRKAQAVGVIKGSGPKYS